MKSNARSTADTIPETVPDRASPRSPAATAGMCVCAWLVPGLGHVLLRRWYRGAILCFAILLMFLLGVGMQGKLYGLQFEQLWLTLPFFADAGVGAAYFVAAFLGVSEGDPTALTFDYGTTYLWVCGLLNYLVILDVFDIARGRKR